MHLVKNFKLQAIKSHSPISFQWHFIQVYIQWLTKQSNLTAVGYLKVTFIFQELGDYRTTVPYTKPPGFAISILKSVKRTLQCLWYRYAIKGTEKQPELQLVCTATSTSVHLHVVGRKHISWNCVFGQSSNGNSCIFGSLRHSSKSHGDYWRFNPDFDVKTVKVVLLPSLRKWRLILYETTIWCKKNW